MRSNKIQTPQSSAFSGEIILLTATMIVVVYFGWLSFAKCCKAECNFFFFWDLSFFFFLFFNKPSLNSVYSCITGSFCPFTTMLDKMWWKSSPVFLYWMNVKQNDWLWSLNLDLITEDGFTKLLFLLLKLEVIFLIVLLELPCWSYIIIYGQTGIYF